MGTRRSSKPPIRMALVISDIHAGGTTALMPPEFKTLRGNVVRANARQAWLWEQWLDFHAWAQHQLAGQRYALIINADVVEGEHHRTKEIISPDDNDHLRLAKLILEPLVRKAGAVVMTRGTECHVKECEGALAAEWGAEVNEGFAPDRAHVTVGDSLGIISHHIGTTSRPWTEATGLGVQLAQEQLEAAKTGLQNKGDRIPQWIVRAHRHRAGFAGDGSGLAIVTPAWQLKTRHAHKVVTASREGCGGVLLDWRESENGVPGFKLWERYLPQPRGVRL